MEANAIDFDSDLVDALREKLMLTDETAVVEEDETLLGKGGLPYNITLPAPPTDRKPPYIKVEKGEPHFESVDNPGKWSEYNFRPEFEKKATGGHYQGRTLPTGATPVPASGPGGKRVAGGWEFHYYGWDGGSWSPSLGRGDASFKNLMPDSRKGKFDAGLLATMGLTHSRMKKIDAIFFYQLLLPMCNPARSGTLHEPRPPFYGEVEKFSQIYAIRIDLGGAYVHTPSRT